MVNGAAVAEGEVGENAFADCAGGGRVRVWSRRGQEDFFGVVGLSLVEVGGREILVAGVRVRFVGGACRTNDEGEGENVPDNSTR